jgi:NAD(P)H dehydrogenase (quinone)
LEDTLAKAKVLVAFYSRNGSVEALAAAVAEGAREAGADVRTRRVRELVSKEVMAGVAGWGENAAAMNLRYDAPSVDDADWADAIVFGTPTRFGVVCSELKGYIDGLGGLWFQGKLNGKVGSVFGATSTIHGGNETTLLSLYATLAHLGLIIVPLGYSDQSLFEAGSPYGATFVSKRDTEKPAVADLAVAKYQGRRVATAASQLAVPSR